MKCETKTYSGKMKSFRNRIMFRLDYYSLPRFKEKYLDEKGEISNNYRETNLTEIERQMVDVDAVAFNLGETLDTILSKSVYFFSEVVFDEAKEIFGDVVVGPFYLFLQLFLQDGVITTRCYERIKEFLFVKKMMPYSTTTCFTCQVDHQKTIIAEEVGSIINIDAFTCIRTDDRSLVNSRHSDEYVITYSDDKTEKPVNVSLCRMLQLAKGENDLYYYNVLVNTNLCIDLNDDFSNMDEHVIDRIIEFSEVESSRCFK